MTRSLEYPYWYVAIVAGSLLNMAAFMLIPLLGYNKVTSGIPVIMVDFMEWQEPVARKVIPAETVTPAKKPEIMPNPKPLIKKTETKPVAEKEARFTEQIVKNKPSIIEEESEEEPEQVLVPVTKKPSETEEAKEILPTPVPVFKLTSMPRFIHRAQFYPPSMRSLGKEAIVKLEVLIDKAGVVRNVIVLESAGAIFDQAAIESMMASTFVPGNVEGKAVAVLKRMPVRFTLR